MKSLLQRSRYCVLTSLAGFIMFILMACTPVAVPPSDSTEVEPAAEDQLRVATSTAFVADWVKQVGGDQVTVVPILPEGADPHDYRPGPQDMVLLSQSDLIFQVGLGLEESWFDQLIANVQEGGAEVVILGEYVDILFFDPHETADTHGDEHEAEDAHKHEDTHEGEHADHDEEVHEDEDVHEHEDAHDHGQVGVDPHFWLDPLQVQSAVSGIATQLSHLKPDLAEVFQDRAAAYNAELEELHHWILGQVETIPSEQRLLVTGHEFLRYFAHRYDFEVVGSISGGTGTAHAHEVPAFELADLVTHMQEENVKAIFTERGHENELAVRVAEEAGIDLIVPLHTGSLGAENSYLGMMRENAQAVVEALQ